MYLGLFGRLLEAVEMRECRREVAVAVRVKRQGHGLPTSRQSTASLERPDEQMDQKDKHKPDFLHKYSTNAMSLRL
jgi:hypothetical protein